MTRRIVVAALDVLILGLVVLTATVVTLGGFVVEFSDVRLSFRTPSRTLL